MECDTCREAASARLDGEDPGMDYGRVEEHLARCTDCRTWLTEATGVTRTLRMRSVDDVPDLSASVLAQAHRRQRRRASAGVLARIALAAVAAGQWAAGLAVIFDQPVGASLPVHGAHEMGAFNLAVAVGFAWTAWRPRWARAQLPLLATLVVVLGVLTFRDLAVGHATAVAEAGHLLLAAGLALTAVLARRYGPPAPFPLMAGGLTPVAPHGGRRAASRVRIRFWRPRIMRPATLARTGQPPAGRGREVA